MNFKIIWKNRNDYELPYTTRIFAGGEVQVKLGKFPVNWQKESHNMIYIDGLIKTSDQFMEAALLANALREELGGSDYSLYGDFHYLPYARQDRVCTRGEAFSLKVFIDMLSAIKVDTFIFDDVHSQVAIDLLKESGLGFYCNTQLDLIFDSIDIQDLILVSPDKGAMDKVIHTSKQAIKTALYYKKVRDLSTGEISGLELLNDVDFVPNARYLIVDDICDGGRTFVPIIKDLIKRGANSVDLYVTHAVLPYGLDSLKQAGLRYLFYANSFLDKDLKDMYSVSSLPNYYENEEF